MGKPWHVNPDEQCRMKYEMPLSGCCKTADPLSAVCISSFSFELNCWVFWDQLHGNQYLTPKMGLLASSLPNHSCCMLIVSCLGRYILHSLIPSSKLPEKKRDLYYYFLGIRISLMSRWFPFNSLYHQLHIYVAGTRVLKTAAIHCGIVMAWDQGLGLRHSQCNILLLWLLPCIIPWSQGHWPRPSFPPIRGSEGFLS